MNDDEAAVLPGVLADIYFTMAREFIHRKLTEAMAEGHISPTIAPNILATYLRHFDTILQIAKRGPYPSDHVNAAHSAMTITMAAFTVGCRDSHYLNRLKQAQGVERAARARAGKAQTSASEQLNEAILALALKHKKPIENFERRADRMAVSVRIKPFVDKRVAELLRAGFKNTKTLGTEAIEKRLLRLTAIKPSDS